MNIADSETAYVAAAVANLSRPFRELWQPDRDSQMAAIEVLLASPLPSELRSQLRDRLTDLTSRRAA